MMGSGCGGPRFDVVHFRSKRERTTRIEYCGRSFLADAAVIACPDCEAFGEVPPDAAAELDAVAVTREGGAVEITLEKAVEIREDFALKNPRGGGLDGAEVVVGRWVADQADVPFQRDVEGQGMGKQQVNRGLGSLVELLEPLAVSRKTSRPTAGMWQSLFSFQRLVFTS